jgi:hypothetical protein
MERRKHIEAMHFEDARESMVSSELGKNKRLLGPRK